MLAAVAVAVALGFGIVAPAIPVFARSFGVSSALAGAVISVFAVMRLVMAAPAGRLVNRFGERRVLAVGIGIVAISSFLAGLARTYPQLLLLRGGGGIGSAMFSVSAMSLLLRSVPSSQRARASGMFSGGFLLGGITGPALGGLVTSISIRAPFFLYAGTLTIAGSIGLFALRRSTVGDRPEPGHRSGTTLRQALGLRAYRAALVANLADSWAAVGVRAAILPLFVIEAMHRSSIWTGIGFVIVAGVNAATLYPAGRYADRHGRRWVLIVGCCLSALAMALIAVRGTNLAVYATAMAVFGLGSGLLDVAPAAVVGDVVAGRGGPVIAVFQMSGDAGSVVGPIAAGLLVDALSFSWAFGVTAGVLGIAAMLGVIAPETRRPAEPVVAAVAEGESGPRALAEEPPLT